MTTCPHANWVSGWCETINLVCLAWYHFKYTLLLFLWQKFTQNVASSLCAVQQAFNNACEVLLISDHPSFLPSSSHPSLSALFSVVLCHHIDTSHHRDGASTPRYGCTLRPSHPLCHLFQPLTPPHKYGLVSFLNSHALSFCQFFMRGWEQVVVWLHLMPLAFTAQN